jgi:HAD superfamily phosphoserine phosphatase-like hydrolase
MNPMIRLEVSVDDQRLDVFTSDAASPIRSFTVSTAAKGVGFASGSFRTPTGRFRIAGKIGDGEPSGTIFRGRVPAGIWRPGDPLTGDLVLSRILLLEGLDPDNANTRERFIYIHGTNQEEHIGIPASHGCVRLRNADMIELFGMVPQGAELIIHPPSRRNGKIIFIDCDSTLSTIEGIDELARFQGESVFQEVVALTNAAMNGEIPLDEVFPRRMEIIRPGRAACERVAALYMETMTPGAAAFVSWLKREGWLPVILSGGFQPLILPLAGALGISHVEAVPLHLDADGCYAGYDANYPTTRNLGKNAIINEWKRAMLPERVVMLGDGISDLETQSDVDAFIGFGGVVSRAAVKAGADHWLDDLADIETVEAILSEADATDSGS